MRYVVRVDQKQEQRIEMADRSLVFYTLSAPASVQDGVAEHWCSLRLGKDALHVG